MATVYTDAGKAITTNRMKGSGSEPLNGGIGTGAGTAAAADTTLFSECNGAGGASGNRIAGTSTQQTTTVTNDTYQVVYTVSATTTLAITNAGLFDQLAFTGGNMLMKGDFATVNLVNGDSIQVTAKLKFA